MKGSKSTLIYGLIAVTLLLLNAQILFAHNWGSWHWDKKDLHLYVFGSHQAEAVAAIADWDRHIRDLKLHTQFKGHEDISVYGANFGATGWWGLASIKNYAYDYWHLWCWCKITHAHATYNSYYGGSGGTGTNSAIRGVLCQEIGHTFGLGHNNTGGCMAKGYYSPSSNVTNSHNWADINNKY